MIMYELPNTVFMRTKLDEAYLRHYGSGKGAAARLFDRVLFFLLVFILVFLIARLITKSVFASAAVGGLAGGVYLLASDIVFRLTFVRSVEKFRKETAKKVLIRKLLLAPCDEIAKEAKTSLHPEYGCELIVFQKVSPVSEDDVYSVLRGKAGLKSVILVSVSGFSDEAGQLARRVQHPSAELINAAGIAGLAAAYKPKEEEIDEEIIASYEKKPARPALSNDFKPGHAVKYLAAGAVTYAFSFISGAGLFLRSIASIVITAAVLSIGLKIYRKHRPEADHS